MSVRHALARLSSPLPQPHAASGSNRRLLSPRGQIRRARGEMPVGEIEVQEPVEVGQGMLAVANVVADRSARRLIQGGRLRPGPSPCFPSSR